MPTILELLSKAEKPIALLEGQDLKALQEEARSKLVENQEWSGSGYR